MICFGFLLFILNVIEEIKIFVFFFFREEIVFEIWFIFKCLIGKNVLMIFIFFLFFKLILFNLVCCFVKKFFNFFFVILIILIFVMFFLISVFVVCVVECVIKIMFFGLILFFCK